LKIKLNGCLFDTIEGFEEESQAVLKVDTLTEHGFQDASKNWQKHWKRYIRAEGHYFGDDCGQ
jgi:hypothetical protein